MISFFPVIQTVRTVLLVCPSVRRPDWRWSWLNWTKHEHFKIKSISRILADCVFLEERPSPVLQMKATEKVTSKMRQQTRDILHPTLTRLNIWWLREDTWGPEPRKRTSVEPSGAQGWKNFNNISALLKLDESYKFPCFCLKSAAPDFLLAGVWFPSVCSSIWGAARFGLLESKNVIRVKAGEIWNRRGYRLLLQNGKKNIYF